MGRSTASSVSRPSRPSAAAREAEAEIRPAGGAGRCTASPIAVKDNYDAARLPATAGSRVRLDHVPTQDAALVARLREAGAILLGKLNTWEFGTGNGGEYFDLPFPTARNPWDTERFAGGSSTGAGASVAAGRRCLRSAPTRPAPCACRRRRRARSA